MAIGLRAGSRFSATLLRRRIRLWIAGKFARYRRALVSAPTRIVRRRAGFELFLYLAFKPRRRAGIVVSVVAIGVLFIPRLTGLLVVLLFAVRWRAGFCSSLLPFALLPFQPFVFNARGVIHDMPLYARWLAVTFVPVFDLVVVGERLILAVGRGILLAGVLLVISAINRGVVVGIGLPGIVVAALLARIITVRRLVEVVAVHPVRSAFKLLPIHAIWLALKLIPIHPVRLALKLIRVHAVRLALKLVRVHAVRLALTFVRIHAVRCLLDGLVAIGIAIGFRCTSLIGVRSIGCLPRPLVLRLAITIGLRYAVIARASLYRRRR